MKQTPAINIFDIRVPTDKGAVRKRELPRDKYDGAIPVKTLWGFLDEYIISGNDNGHLYCWDANNLDELYRNDVAHKGVINDMQVGFLYDFSKKRLLFPKKHKKEFLKAFFSPK